MDIQWTSADAATYSADEALIEGLTLLVGLDDEGPSWPAYYWCITRRCWRFQVWDKMILDEGWAASPEAAKIMAVKAAENLLTTI